MIAIQRGLFISADTAHALHPNYADKHQSSHQPILGEGIVLKVNANHRYTTGANSEALFKKICKDSKIKI